MSSNVQVLVAGRSRVDLDTLKALLHDHSGIELTTRHIENNHADPLDGVQVLPNVLILHLSENWEQELNALSARPAAGRPPVLVVGPGTDIRMLRHAMQAGARDFLTQPVSAEELSVALRQIAQEQSRSGESATSRLTAVINAKGGSGATLVACNLAHVMTTVAKLRVAVMDLDLQFGTLPLYLDLAPTHGILQTVNSADSLDTVALEACMAKHQSGLHVLGPVSNELVFPEEISVHNVERLLGVAALTYEHVVVDLPRHFDRITLTVMERADQVVLITQQSVTHVRDTKRLMALLVQELSIPPDRIVLVVNRFQPKGEVSVEDIEQTLGYESPMLIPNDFKRVTECVNLGIPLYQHYKRAPITKGILALGKKLSGKPVATKKGYLGRAISNFFGQ